MIHTYKYTAAAKPGLDISEVRSLALRAAMMFFKSNIESRYTMTVNASSTVAYSMEVIKATVDITYNDDRTATSVKVGNRGNLLPMQLA